MKLPNLALFKTLRAEARKLSLVGRVYVRLQAGVKATFFLFGAFVSMVMALDHLYPADLADKTYATVVVAENGLPLRRFPDATGVWRHHVNLEDVSPYYLQALVGYEDRWFYQHPGVNPLALLRSAADWVTSGTLVSGGSTLTMQVARLRY